MHKLFLLTMLSASVAFAQAPAANPAPPAAQSVTPPSPLLPQAAPQAPAEVAPNAPVITLHGLCPEKPANADDCQTVITRAEFEHLANTLSPNMPANTKQQLASEYSRMLVLSAEARKRNVEKDQHYQDLMTFMKTQLLAQEMMRILQTQAKPTEADVQKYYQENPGKYETLTARRLFIPRGRPDEVHAMAQPGKPAAPKAAAPKQPTDAELQAEGEKLRARLVAGEDFDKLQKEVYVSAGYKTPPPPTTVPEWRRDSVSPVQAPLFELKAGEFSKVMMEPAGAYIYQVQGKKAIPLDEVKTDIQNTLANDRMRQAVEGVMTGIKPEVNQAYFRALAMEAAAAGPASDGRPMPPPRQSPPPSLSNPAPKPVAPATPKGK